MAKFEMPKVKKLKSLTVAYVMIWTAKEKAASVAEEVGAMKSVHHTVLVTGDYDVLAEVWAENNEDLGAVVLSIQAVDGVERTQTSVVSHAYGDAGIFEDIVNGPPF